MLSCIWPLAEFAVGCHCGKKLCRPEEESWNVNVAPVAWADNGLIRSTFGSNFSRQAAICSEAPPATTPRQSDNSTCIFSGKVDTHCLADNVNSNSVKPFTVYNQLSNKGSWKFWKSRVEVLQRKESVQLKLMSFCIKRFEQTWLSLHTTGVTFHL